MPQQAYDVQGYASSGICRREEQQDFFGPAPDGSAKKRDHYDRDGRLFARPREIFEAVEANRAGHQIRQP